MEPRVVLRLQDILDAIERIDLLSDKVGLSGQLAELHEAVLSLLLPKS